jgi:small-conductance mechanosensitive channel
MLLGFVNAGTGAPPPPPPPPASIQPKDILGHLSRTIAWYRNVENAAELASASGEILVRQSARQTALRSLQFAFDFARAEAVLLARATQPPPNGDSNAGATNPAANGRNLDQAAHDATDRINNLQTRIGDLNAAMAKAPERALPVLRGQRAELEAELSLAKEIQKTIQSAASLNGAGAGLSGGLIGQIDNLERSVPEARHDQRSQTGAPSIPAPADSKTSAASVAPFRADSSGVVSLAAEAISLLRAGTRISEVIAETDDLIQETNRLRAPLRAEIRREISRSEDLTNDSASENVQDLAADKQEIDRLAAQFRQLSTAVVPLREQGLVAGTTLGNLQELLNSARQQRSEVTRYLLLRSTGLTFAVIFVLVISIVGRRATFRYIKDPRRRRQFMVLRKVIVGCTVITVLVLGFVSDFSSLATYAGFLTAGIAVALQNVLLAVVAYFFLIGRYGVRIGDRVTISGVTGNVIDIGLVRIYLMELTRQGTDLHPTGRVVVFSNAVLFSPTALFKQMPGADFVWHKVTLTLTAESSCEIAKRRLTAAVLAVYAQYRAKIEKQHAALEESVDLSMSAPEPDCRFRYTDKGLEFSVHYPAELKDAAATDEKVVNAARAAVESEPGLQLAPGGMPRVEQP